MATSSSPSSVLDIYEYIIEGAHIREYARATANSQDEPLLLHIKKYVPKDNAEPKKGDLTVVAAHANGFPKELYEPLFEDYVQECAKLGVRIRAIWIADVAWQGRSGVLNENKLGNDPGWLDYSRDITHMINTFRMPRPILAMGHSFGALALVNVALNHPRLFSGMVLLDPTIGKFSVVKPVGNATLSIKRRDVWPSREVAAQAFAKNAFYRTWDKRSLDRYIKYGLREDTSSATPGQVKLTTSKHQEVFTFVRPLYEAYDETGKNLLRPDLVPDLDFEEGTDASVFVAYRPEGTPTVARLPTLRPGVLYVFGALSAVSPKQLCEEKLTLTGTGIGGSGGVEKGRVKAITHPDRGHLIPLEEPLFCARHAAEWTKSEVERWWVEERDYEEWTRRPSIEKVTASEEFKRRLGPPDQGSRTKAKI